jgi:succinyl-CoA synthetase beta subunit
VEINPLARTEGGLLALDAKVVLDDNALFRQGGLAALRDEEAETAAVREARALGMSYVELGGDIGCLVNGAGLAMATMDALALYGGEPANFLDIGGGARAEEVGRALGLVLDDPRVGVVLINIFGGITRGDEVARGLLEALEELSPSVPLVVRLAGTDAVEGLRLLERAGVHSAESMESAAKLAVELTEQGGRTDDSDQCG